MWIVLSSCCGKEIFSNNKHSNQVTVSSPMPSMVINGQLQHLEDPNDGYPLLVVLLLVTFLTWLKNNLSS